MQIVKILCFIYGAIEITKDWRSAVLLIESESEFCFDDGDDDEMRRFTLVPIPPGIISTSICFLTLVLSVVSVSVSVLTMSFRYDSNVSLGTMYWLKPGLRPEEEIVSESKVQALDAGGRSLVGIGSRVEARRDKVMFFCCLSFGGGSKFRTSRGPARSRSWKPGKRAIA